MTHFFVGFISLASWFFGISAALLAALLTVEFLQHRRVYRSDAWSEETLLEERIASGTLPAAMHTVMADQEAPARQSGRAIKGSAVRTAPLVHNVVR